MALIKETIAILKANGKFVGMSMTSTDEQEQRFWLDLGADMITSGVEFDYVMRASKKNAEQLRRVIAEYQK